jgi:Type IV leader peptidase family
MVGTMDPLLIIAITQVCLLVCAAMSDIAARTISNKICALLAVLAVARLPFFDPSRLTVSVTTTAVLFIILFILYARGYLGGGDVKLLSALAIGLSFTHCGGCRDRLYRQSVHHLFVVSMLLNDGATCDAHRCLTGLPSRLAASGP